MSRLSYSTLSLPKSDLIALFNSLNLRSESRKPSDLTTPPATMCEWHYLLYSCCHRVIYRKWDHCSTYKCKKECVVIQKSTEERPQSTCAECARQREKERQEREETNNANMEGIDGLEKGQEEWMEVEIAGE